MARKFIEKIDTFILPLLTAVDSCSLDNPEMQTIVVNLDGTQLHSCSLDNREMQTIVADLDGTQLRSSSPFPYFMLIAFGGGSRLRALLLLLISPLVYIFLPFHLGSCRD
jgi:hypothetical protein